VQPGVGSAGREVVGQRPGEHHDEDVMAFGIDTPVPPDVLVEHAIVDEAKTVWDARSLPGL
jgi:hypothetical protein